MKKRYSFLTLIIILVVISVLVVQLRPSAVLNRSIQKLSQLKTAHIITHVTLANSSTTQQLLGEEGAVNLIIDGQYAKQASEPDNLAAHINLTISTDSVSVTIDGEARLINDKIYLLVNKAPAAIPTLEQIKGRWISFDRTAQNTTPKSDSVAIADLFTDVQQQGIATINGQKTVHYNVQATKQAVIQFVDTLANVLGSRLSKDQLQTLEQDITTNSLLPTDIYISFWPNNIRQITSHLQAPSGNDINLSVLIDKPNQPVQIETPQAITIEDLINQPATPPR